MDKVRLRVIGFGSMGSIHAAQIKAGAIPGVVLGGVCDHETIRQKGADPAMCFTDARAMLACDWVDAVSGATPHHSHLLLGLAVVKVGVHLLVEKPIAVQRKDAPAQCAAARHARVFGATFNERRNPLYRRLRTHLRSEELGPVRRIIRARTDWFRTHAKYASGGWRGWKPSTCRLTRRRTSGNSWNSSPNGLTCHRRRSRRPSPGLSRSFIR